MRSAQEMSCQESAKKIAATARTKLPAGQIVESSGSICSVSRTVRQIWLSYLLSFEEILTSTSPNVGRGKPNTPDMTSNSFAAVRRTNIYAPMDTCMVTNESQGHSPSKYHRNSCPSLGWRPTAGQSRQNVIPFLVDHNDSDRTLIILKYLVPFRCNSHIQRSHNGTRILCSFVGDLIEV